MTGIVLLALFLSIGPVALRFGVDSRECDERVLRPWWPGSGMSTVAISPPVSPSGPGVRIAPGTHPGTSRTGAECSSAWPAHV